MKLALTAGIAIGMLLGSLKFVLLLAPTASNHWLPRSDHKRERSWLAETSLDSTRADIDSVDQTQASPTAETHDQSESAIESRRILIQKLELLKRGRTFLQSIQGYTAQLDKREVVRDELLDEQSMFIKCRRTPFSIYLRWTKGDVGREAIYIEGKNSGKIIAHDGGWKAKIPAFHMSPDCWLAMRDARYPITNAGLLYLIESMLEVHEHDLQTSAFASCEVAQDVLFDGRSCLRFTTTYKSKATSPSYRKSITLIDHEWNVPLQSEHFEWPGTAIPPCESEIDECTLIERYAFRELDFHCHLSDEDFDQLNHEYRFR